VFDGVQIAILARSNEFSFSFLLADLTHDQVSELAVALRQRIMDALVDFAARTQRGESTPGWRFSGRATRARMCLPALTWRWSLPASPAATALWCCPTTHTEKATLGSFGWRTLIESALVESRWRLLRQPVVRLLAAKEVIHSECMARLVDGQGELVPASSFMPMAARHRLMTDVDRAMVTLALQQVHDEGPRKQCAGHQSVAPEHWRQRLCGVAEPATGVAGGCGQPRCAGGFGVWRPAQYRGPDAGAGNGARRAVWPLA
jgi:hypothetical protein